MCSNSVSYKLRSLFLILCLFGEFLTEVNGAVAVNRRLKRQLPSANDELLNTLDAEMQQITNDYMQALFTGTFNAEMDERMQELNSQINKHLDTLYFQNRFTDYVIYENRIAHKLQVFAMLKRLFGFDQFINQNNMINNNENDNSLNENLFSF